MSNATSGSDHPAVPPTGRAELNELFRALGESMRHRMKSILAGRDLSPPLFAALRVLTEPRSMGDVADLLACDASYVTGLADRLEERGLAERRDHPTDRRVKQLALTDEGEQMREALLRDMEGAHHAFPTLTDEEVQTLVRLLRKIVGEAT